MGISGDNSLSSSPFFEPVDWMELKDQSVSTVPYIPLLNSLEEKIQLRNNYSKSVMEYTGDQEIFRDFGFV